MKAVFKRKYCGKGFDRDSVYLIYEYRGKEYIVYENRAKGNEPLAWQHKNEQARIDKEIEEENKSKKEARYEDTAEYGFNLFWESVNE